MKTAIDSKAFWKMYAKECLSYRLVKMYTIKAICGREKYMN